MGRIGHSEDLAEQNRELRKLLDSSSSLRSLVSVLDGVFPGTGGHRVTIDLARILDVDPSTGTVRVACLHLGTSPDGVQWISPMLDPKTGNGMYFVPKPGMYGIYVNVGGNDFIVGMFGVTEAFGKNLFLNFREPLPEGGVGIRTSAETKTIWGPNLTLIQAANFCKIALQRAAKRLSMIFYKLDLTSLGGSIKWTTELADRISSFTLAIRNRLSPGKTAQGRNPKSDGAREFKLKLGAESATDTNMIKATLAKVKAKGEGNALETAAVGRLRKVVRSFLGDSGITDPATIKANPFLNQSLGGFVLGSDVTLDLMTEAIVGAATFVRQTRVEGLNGLVDLAPEVDSVENLNDGSLVALGGRSPKSLFSDTEVFVEANRLATRKDSATGATVRVEPGASLLAAARNGFVREDGIDSEDLLFEFKVGEDGSLRVKQKPPAHGSRGVPEWLRTALETTSSLGILAENGPVDVGAGKGFRLQFKDGAVILGSKQAGITFTPDGDIEIRGRNVKMIALDERPAYELKGFRTEEDAIEDFMEEDDRTFYQKALRDIAKDMENLYYTHKTEKGRTFRTGTRTSPIQKDGTGGTPAPFTKYPKRDRDGDLPEDTRDDFGRPTNPAWKAYYDNLKKWNRDFEWDKRRRLLVKLKAASKSRAEAFQKLLDSFKPKGKRTDAQIAAAPLTDSGTSLSVTARGITAVSNSSILLRSGVRVRTEQGYPSEEVVGTAQAFKDAALKASGVPEFAKIDKAEADLKARKK